MAFCAVQAEQPSELIIERTLCRNPRSTLADESNETVFDFCGERGCLAHLEATARHLGAQCPHVRGVITELRGKLSRSPSRRQSLPKSFVLDAPEPSPAQLDGLTGERSSDVERRELADCPLGNGEEVTLSELPGGNLDELVRRVAVRGEDFVVRCNADLGRAHRLQPDELSAEVVRERFRHLRERAGDGVDTYAARPPHTTIADDDLIASVRKDVVDRLRPVLGRHQRAGREAEDAAKVAAGEEDRPRPAGAAQAVLLAEVREVGGDDGVAADRAQARDVGAPVDLAAARADDAALAEQLEALGGAALELGAR